MPDRIPKLSDPFGTLMKAQVHGSPLTDAFSTLLEQQGRPSLTDLTGLPEPHLPAGYQGPARRAMRMIDRRDQNRAADFMSSQNVTPEEPADLFGQLLNPGVAPVAQPETTDITGKPIPAGQPRSKVRGKISHVLPEEVGMSAKPINLYRP